ncbi:MAG: hypothetical protein JW809_02470 [Pirellulales bacterium]|nr:hypothetical protein [Pirellulales bacterium]
MVLFRTISVVFLLLATAAATLGQEQPTPTTTTQTVIMSPSGTPVIVGPGGVVSPAMPPGMPMPGPQPAEEKKDKPDDKTAKDKKDDKDKKDKDAKDEPPATVPRPVKPPAPPDPKELEVRPGDDHRLQFHFKGQPWPAVLEWLADVSGMSLDWQEAPGGYLNLTTTRRYTVEETRDLLNRLLLDRGFVLLTHGEVLSLVNLKKLDPSLVPRVAPEELDGRQPHEFVKVSFMLDRLVADEAVDELKPMLSPNGKMTAMSATNRIEAMDAVANLRQIASLLAGEQAAGTNRHPPRVFPLVHRRASEIVVQLEALLGLSSKSPAMPTSPEQMQRMAEQQQQMMMQAQQMAQQGGEPGKPGKPPKPKRDADVRLVADDRNRCIIAQAPPDKLAIIDQAIKALDVENPNSEALPAMLERMHTYHLATLDPEPLVRTLQEIGNLDLGTRLEVDKSNKAIIAYATLADHVTIRALIDKLDGTGRRFEVIPLLRLKADYVAGTIQHMIFGGKGEQEKKTDSSSRRWYGDFFGESRKEPDKSDQFRVDAEIEHNWLLLWANDVEIEEVRKLLVKLGELPPEGGRRERIRVLDVYEDAEVRELMDRLRDAWPRGNPLDIDPGATEPRPGAEPETPPVPMPPEPKHARRTGPAFETVALADEEDRVPGDRADFRAGEKGTVPLAPAGAPLPDKRAVPPAATSPSAVKITRNPAGRLVITSEDTEALDMMEDMIARLAPPRKGYRVFRLNHAWAYDVADNLEAFFKEEGQQQPILDWWGDVRYSQGASNENNRLSRRRPLRFIADSASNSVLVQGADANQMRQIEDLVKFYDQPEPVDSQNLRQTATIPLRWSKARTVAEAVKEVYRDLLSENDKAFSGGKKQDRPMNPYTVVYRGGTTPEKTGEKAPRFKGLLSIGVDEVSNTVIVSAPTFLFDQVRDLVETLDRAAQPVSTVRVVKLGPGVSAAQLQQVLSDARARGGAKPEASKPPTPPTPPKPEHAEAEK